MNHQKIIAEIELAKEMWLGEIASEILGGNVVKENYAKGAVMGLEIALGEIRRAVEASNKQI